MRVGFVFLLLLPLFQCKMNRGYVVFHRHGHRSPISNVFRNEAEKALWQALVVDPHALQSINQVYPVNNYPTNKLPYDLSTYPFGSLTWKGYHHMQKVGKKLRNHFPNIVSSNNTYEVYCTNYQRTQASVQGLLLGMEAPHNTSITVRNSLECALSFYEGRAELATLLTSRVQSSDSFVRFEAAVADDAQRIIEHIPFFRKADGSVNWMAISDYFACRRSHDLETKPELSTYAVMAGRHLCRRYAHYFLDKEHLAHFSQPLILDIISSIRAIQNATSPHVVIYSCHDVNLLGLLYALQAKILNSGAEVNLDFWPGYGGNVVFEVAASTEEQEDISIKAYYNMRPLPIALTGSEFRESFTLTDLETLSAALERFKS